MAASRVMKLDATRTAHALAIALSQPNYALYPGLMGCKAKLITAATPAVNGLQVAQLAAEGLTGRLDVPTAHEASSRISASTRNPTC